MSFIHQLAQGIYLLMIKLLRKYYLLLNLYNKVDLIFCVTL